MTQRSIIVLIPTKNEAWILERVLASTSLWADYIIVADQGSSDSTREIASAFPKVILLDNTNSEFSEVDRQRLMIDAARSIPGQHVLVALDADEILSANVIDSREWKNAINAPPGTVISFAKLDLHPTPDTYCLHSVHDRKAYIPFAYVDDGAEHEGETIHTTRIPKPEGAPVLHLDEIVLLHYSMCNMPRFRSKDRWYACFDRVNKPTKGIVIIHRESDWVERLQSGFNIRPTRPEWFDAYEQAGIDMHGTDWKTDPRTARFWWDFDILRMFKRHGVDTFARLDLWSVDWEAVRQEGIALGIEGLPEEPLRRPRRVSDILFRQTLIRARKSRFRLVIDRVMHRIERGLFIKR